MIMRLTQVLSFSGCFAALAFTVSAHAAGSANVEIQLDVIADRLGVEQSQIRSVNAAVLSSEAAWRSGVDGNVDSSWLTFERASEQANAGIANSLHVAVQGNTQTLTAKLCDATLSCQPVKVSSQGKVSIVQMGAISWKFEFHGNPCPNKSAQCEMKIPSWSLAKRAASKDGSLSGLPQELIAVDYGDGVALLNPLDKSVWFKLNLSQSEYFTSLGKMRSVRVLQNGAINLVHEGGSALIDFRNDRAWVVNRLGVVGSKFGLGYTSNMKFANTFQKSKSEEVQRNGKVLLVTDKVIVWEDGMSWFDADKMKFEDFIPAHKPVVRAFHEDEVITLIQSEGAAFSAQSISKQTRLNIGAQNLVALKEKENVSDVFVLKGKIYIKSADGIDMFVNGKREAQELKLSAENVYVAPNGDLFVRRIESGQCLWSHNPAQDGKSFAVELASPLTLACGEKFAISTSQFGVAAISYNKKKVSVQILRVE